MRIQELSVSGFRGFAGRQSFDLDASAIILCGANGQGKTSFFDAILWSLTGMVPRIGADASRLLSMYSETGEMSVSVGLVSPKGEALRVTRSFDGESQTVTLHHGDRVSRGSEAKGELLHLLWPPALVAENEEKALCSAITRGVYLQQDVVRQFIEADDDQERFNAISEMVGTGRATDIQLALEKARTNWARATNKRARENEAVFAKLEQLQAQVDQLNSKEDPGAAIQDRWNEWWDRARELGVVPESEVAAGSSEAPRRLDAAIKKLSAIRLSAQRRVAELRALLESARSLPEAPTVDIGELEDRKARSEEELSQARVALAKGREVAAELRRKQIELQEKEAELRTLAEVALRHLGEHCPVCAQEYDQAATEIRLKAVLGDPGSIASPDDDAGAVEALGIAVEGCEKRLAAITTELQAAKGSLREHEGKRAVMQARLRELGLEAPDDSGVLVSIEEATKKEEGFDKSAQVLARDGEALGLNLAEAREHARRSELTKALESIRREASELREEERARKETWELAGTILDSLRKAGVRLVNAEVERIGPLFQQLYSAIEPHPTFRAVSFLSTMTRGRGRLSAQVQDLSQGIETDAPCDVLSSSQMNVLAVSVFLAFNVGFQALPLQGTLLDDPLQSLDEINLLGLIDLLRRVSEQRQLLISTHDDRLGRLLERKLRPVGDDQRTVVISFDGWGRNGPITSQRDVSPDREPLRLIAAEGS